MRAGLARRDKMGWSDENIEWLKRLHAEGLSMSAIAREMGQGFTLNAVLGKIPRLGLVGPHAVTAVFKTTVANKVVKPRAPRAAPVIAATLAPKLNPDGSPITFRQAGRMQCLWMADEAGADAQVCGHDTKGGRFCPHHQSRLSGKPAGAALGKHLANAKWARGRTRA